MKNQIKEMLNNLSQQKVYSGGDENGWKIGNDLMTCSINFNEYDTSKVNVSIKLNTGRNYNSLQNLKLCFTKEELTPLLNLIRKEMQSKWYRNSLTEEKREQLLELFKNAPTAANYQKESITIIEGNEEKKYYFRANYKEVTEESLQKLNFVHYMFTELSKDNRLNNAQYESKNYEIIISTQEFCEIFNIDLEEVKNKVFGKYFEIKDSEQKVITKKTPVIVDEPESISKKIKKIL